MKIKRGRTIFSRLIEISDESELRKTIEDSIEKSMNKVFPKILDTLRKELRSTINRIVDNKIKNLEIKSNAKFLRPKVSLRNFSENELLDCYSRTKNLKIWEQSFLATWGSHMRKVRH